MTTPQSQRKQNGTPTEILSQLFVEADSRISSHTLPLSSYHENFPRHLLQASRSANSHQVLSGCQIRLSELDAQPGSIGVCLCHDALVFYSHVALSFSRLGFSSPGLSTTNSGSGRTASYTWSQNAQRVLLLHSGSCEGAFLQSVLPS